MRFFGVSVLAILISVLACSSESGGNPTATIVPLDPDDGAQHIPVGTFVDSYSVTPATSGPHWIGPTTPFNVSAPADWGVYNFALPDEILVHNLEHGGIGIHYDCPDGCEDLKAQLERLVPANPSQHIVSPYPDMPARIAITAWRRHLYLDQFDGARIRQFIDTFQDEAPESVPGNLF
jgi:hypothetical protein